MNVAIIDYGAGNLHSVVKAFTWVGGDVDVVKTPEPLLSASHIVLPGVGSFKEGMERLTSLGMVEALGSAVRDGGRAFLGICAGMQMLADHGREHGDTEGLGWIPGEVTKIIPNSPNVPVPHTGWDQLNFERRHPVLDGLSDGARAHFVHSYGFVSGDPKHVLANVDYGGSITAMVARDNIVGTQFHPEKSQSTGLSIIQNFLKWRP